MNFLTFPVPYSLVSDGGEHQLAGGVEGDVEGHLAVVVADKIERIDLERSLYDAEIRDDDLPGADSAVEDVGADQSVGSGVLEDAGAGDTGVLGAGAFKQFAPAAGGFGMRDVDTCSIERERRDFRPATVKKVPLPSLSTLSRRSLPFWAAIGDIRSLWRED